MAALEFEWIDSDTGFQALAADWRDLETRARPHAPSRRFVWQHAAWTCVSAPRGCRLRLLVGRHQGRVVLILPLVEEGAYLRFLSSEKFEYRDILVEDSMSADSWADAALATIRTLPGPSCLDLRNIPERSTIASALARTQVGGQRVTEESPVIHLNRYATWDDYTRHLPARMVADQKRQWRRLGQLPGGFVFRTVGPDDVGPVVDWIFDHKLRWAAARNLSVGVLPQEGYQCFIKAILSDALVRDRAVLCCIAGEDRIASAGFGFIQDQRFNFYMFAYDADFGALSPSRLLLEGLIKWCMNRRLTMFDFLPGHEAYKRVWADDAVPVFDVLIPLTLRGRLRLFWSRHAVGWLTGLQWLRRRYESLPAPLRSRLRRVLLAE